MINSFLHLSGNLKCTNLSISGKLDCGNLLVSGKLECEDLSISGDMTLGGDLLPYYTDEYIVTPKIFQQNLDTDNKSLTSDIIVRPIPYSEVTNPEGGLTVIIGGEF